MASSDIFAALRWWLALFVIGAVAWPLAHWLFGRLADKGYAFVKMLGLLLGSYLFWLGGSLGFLGNNLGGILIALAGVAGLSYYAHRRTEGAWWQWTRANWRHVLLVEGVFVIVFALWVWVRSQNPSITATEKPMEFAFLNTIGRSPSFPPLDPWLSGFAISYYYFGYVMTSLLARLAFVAEPIAFNLGIAWLMAGSAMGAFGIIYNLIRAGGERFKELAILFGLMGAVALPMAGNGQMLLEILHGNGVGSTAFWEWLDVRDVNTPPSAETEPRFVNNSGWWWWRSSRVIHEYYLDGRAENGFEPIAEFPGFSFILGDMHPHVLALPFAFLSLAVGLLWWLQPGAMVVGRKPNPDEPDDDPPQPSLNPFRELLNQAKAIINHVGLPLYALTVIVLGGTSFLNTWDVLIHLFVIVGAFVLAQWRERGRWDGYLLTQAILLAMLLMIPAIVLYFPFYLGFRSQAGAPFLLPMLMRPTRLTHFLIIFGMPLLAIVPLLISIVVRQKNRPWRVWAATFCGLLVGLHLVMLFFSWIITANAESASRVINLANELGVALTPAPAGSAQLGWAFGAIGSLLPVILRERLAYPMLMLFLAALIGLVVMWLTGRFQNNPPQRHGEHRGDGNSDHPILPFVLLLILTGTLLTIGPEFVYLKDNFSLRLNTIFKFYYQAWVMLGVAALFGLAYLLMYVKVTGRFVTVAYTALLLVAMLFPIYAVQSRSAEYRGPVTAEERRPPTLNGLAYVEHFNPNEYAALMWLRDNVEGSPVVLEAVGGAYSDYARVSANTGLPTLLGWANHENQWRGNEPEIGNRDPIIRRIYNETDFNVVVDLLNQYEIEYIFVGGKEQGDYPELGLDKFANNLEIAFQSGNVTIYRWQPQ